MSNVFGFGAVGDGIADDTQALQHTFEAGDGVLRLNKGTYRIANPLVLDLTKTGFGAVRGEGATSRIVMAGAGPAIRGGGDHQGTAWPSSVQAHTWDMERFPTINGIEIVGEEPSSDVFSHHRALSTCHLAGIAARLNRKITWDPQQEMIVCDDQAQGFVACEYRKGYEIG